ncbi:MAG: hypothetical protein QXW82_02380 [Candidatus Bathyarchaeia archaeon]
MEVHSPAEETISSMRELYKVSLQTGKYSLSLMLLSAFLNRLFCNSPACFSLYCDCTLDSNLQGQVFWVRGAKSTTTS